MYRSAAVVLSLLLAPPSVAQVWTKLSPNAQPPTVNAHAMSGELSRRSIVMTGGNGSQGDTWTWNGTDWTQHKTGLPVLLYASMCFDVPRQRSVLFGGQTNGPRQNDTYEWDGKAWAKMSPANRPSPRYGACMAFDWKNNVSVLFSGHDGTPYSAETWTWDGKDWTLASSTGPKGRIYPAMCYDQRRQVCVLFAGYSLADVGDTWEWDGQKWTEIKTSNSPPARWGHVLVYDFGRGRVVLTGGYSSGSRTTFGDTWIYDGKDWTQLSPSSSPPARRLAGGAYDFANSRTMMYGGTVGGNETWHFDVGTPAIYSVYGSGCPGSAGTPALAAAQGSLPKINTTFTAELKNLPAVAPVAMFLGFSNTTWGAIPLPFKLDGLGATGCSLLTSPDILTPMAGSAGVAKLVVPIPNDLNLLGVGWYHQALVLDPAANAFGASFSNGATARVGS